MQCCCFSNFLRMHTLLYKILFANVSDTLSVNKSMEKSYKKSNSKKKIHRGRYSVSKNVSFSSSFIEIDNVDISELL